MATRRAPLSSEASTDRARLNRPVLLFVRRGAPGTSSSPAWPTLAVSSSTSVPRTVTLSPTDTMRSRPGQATVGEPSAGTTAMGASDPNRARSEAYRSTGTSEVTNRVPSSSIW